MKLIHLSDLHLGKRVNEFSMLEDQQYILGKIIEIIDDERPDAVLIAGDIYDKSTPAEEAMLLWDDFLRKLVDRHVQIFVIGGNHDSIVRLSMHNSLLDYSGVHIAPAFVGANKPFELKDDYGSVYVHMLPFVKPITVQRVYQDEEINSYTDACKVATGHMNIDKSQRNILIAHQFVTGATRSDSEEIVGGLDNVDASVFDDFDYVALGHIHGKQYIGRESVRYCGTPLKYSFSEKNHKKAVTVIELKDKSDILIREVNLVPLRDMREIRGVFADVIASGDGCKEQDRLDDYLHVVLTDEEDVPEAFGKLKKVYPHIMKLSYDNTRTRENHVIEKIEDVDKRDAFDLFGEFYEIQNNQPMNDAQRKFVKELIESIRGYSNETT